METAVAISDRMKYGVKPSAVRSENYLHNIKASQGPSFEVQLGQRIIFDVPALGNGYFCDFSTSYFRVKVDVTLGTAITQASGATIKAGNGYVRFERGPERVCLEECSFRMQVGIYWRVLRTTMICTVWLNYSQTVNRTEKGSILFMVKG